MPSIYPHWKSYQAKLLDKLKEDGKDLDIGGDGKHDSMDHSAKYGAYSVFCFHNSKIKDFALVQVCNKAGGFNSGTIFDLNYLFDSKLISFYNCSVMKLETAQLWNSRDAKEI